MSNTRGVTFKLAGILGIAMLVVIVSLFLPPIPQDPAYHDFIDQRTLYGVPNFWNVASNVPFVIAGLLGLLLLAGRRPVPGGLPELRTAARVFFTGVLLTGFGSAYYHLEPSNASLFWDRLPMTLSFMAFFAMIIGENLSPGLGRALLWPLLAVGVLSVVYWHITERAGHGDLRPYGLVQFLPMVLIPVILLTFRSRSQRRCFPVGHDSCLCCFQDHRVLRCGTLYGDRCAERTFDQAYCRGNRDPVHLYRLAQAAAGWQ